jgi:membrane associated rhomboid family serine protease
MGDAAERIQVRPRNVYPMIPLGDDVKGGRFSSINTLVVAANIAVFGAQIWLNDQANFLISSFGLVPAKMVEFFYHPVAAGLDQPITLVTSIFIHVGVLHLAGNMLYLLIFGPAVERRFGHTSFFMFYLCAGIAAGLATVWMSPQSTVPVVGASGAIAGVLGAYFVLYPRARILTVLPAPLVLTAVRVPAVAYLLFWFALQLYAGSSAPRQATTGAVAWWAHVGGFLFGIGLAPLIASAAPAGGRKTERAPAARPRKKRER